MEQMKPIDARHLTLILKQGLSELTAQI